MKLKTELNCNKYPLEKDILNKDNKDFIYNIEQLKNNIENNIKELRNEINKNNIDGKNQQIQQLIKEKIEIIKKNQENIDNLNNHIELLKNKISQIKEDLNNK